MTTIAIPYCVPSLNKTSRQHWSCRKRDVDMCTNLLRVYGGHCPQATGKRKVHIISYRRQRCTDEANYIGGCKSLIDAIVRRGLLVDDRDKLASFTYEQRVMSQMPEELKALHGGKAVTVLEIEEAPANG